MFVSCVSCVLLIGSWLCDDLITRTEDSYRVCVCVCARLNVYGLVISAMWSPRLVLGSCATGKRKEIRMLMHHAICVRDRR